MPEKEDLEIEGAPEFWTIQGPEWGEMVTIGVVDGSKIKIERPTNSVAQAGIMPAALIGLALHDRIVELEERLAKLEVSS